MNSIALVNAIQLVVGISNIPSEQKEALDQIW